MIFPRALLGQHHPAPGPRSPTSPTSPATASTMTASARPPASPTAPTTSGTGFPSSSPPRSRCSSATTRSLTGRSRAGLSTLRASTPPRLTTLPAARTSWSAPLSSSKKPSKRRGERERAAGDPSWAAAPMGENVGSVASFYLGDFPLCSSVNDAAEERWHDRF